IENFLKLLQEDFGVSVNKTVEESILQAKRYQLQELPSVRRYKIIAQFLQTNRRLAFQRLSDTFTYDNWRQLAQFTLISVQVFIDEEPEKLNAFLSMIISTKKV
ncbi:uncharacterized protein LOC118648379, partial [Monomorium pharaonis]|uniref:uncharacterized protein LOC118648379 n=1 Tax=Monomorium pharaonis TaxID=307658 RepID=UPI001747763C